jgi:hypothetical protein
MDRLTSYRQIIKKVLTDYAQYQPSNREIEVQALFDEERDHYQVLGVGWEGKKRIYGCSVHFDIKDGKIWLQENNTEIDFAQSLVEMGVPKEDIVIGFHTPLFRQYSGYALC